MKRGRKAALQPRAGRAAGGWEDLPPFPAFQTHLSVGRGEEVPGCRERQSPNSGEYRDHGIMEKLPPSHGVPVVR